MLRKQGSEGEEEGDQRHPQCFLKAPAVFQHHYVSRPCQYFSNHINLASQHLSIYISPPGQCPCIISATVHLFSVPTFELPPIPPLLPAGQVGVALQPETVNYQN